jgi:hypothetical protein
MYLFENDNDYKEIQNIFRQELASFFPAIHNYINAFSETISQERMKKTPIFYNEMNFLKRYIKNLDIEIRIDSSPTKQVWSLPWLEDLQTLKRPIPIINTSLFSQVWNKEKIVERAKKLTNPEIRGDKIIYPSSDIKILLFESKGLIPVLETERQRISIALYEIGMWGVEPKYILQFGAGWFVVSLSSSLTTILETISPFLDKPSYYIMHFPIIALVIAGTMLITAAYRARTEEADRYVKKLGYGNDYSEVLEITHMKIRNDATYFISILDQIRNTFNKMHQVLPKFISIFTPEHNIKDRIGKLRENDLLNPNTNPYKQLLEEDEIILSSKDQNDLKILTKQAKMICNHVDKMLARKINIILPQM